MSVTRTSCSSSASCAATTFVLRRCEGTGSTQAASAKKPYLVKATGLVGHWRSCIKFSKTSGICIDAAVSHDIDLMRWFLGGEVTEVYAAGTTFKHPEFAENGDTETGMAMLKFDNGFFAFRVGRTAPHGYHTETEIVGTEAHIRVAGVPWKDRRASWYTT